VDAANKYLTLPKVSNFSQAAEIENDRLRHVYTSASTTCQMRITLHSSIVSDICGSGSTLVIVDVNH